MVCRWNRLLHVTGLITGTMCRRRSVHHLLVADLPQLNQLTHIEVLDLVSVHQYYGRTEGGNVYNFCV